MIKINVAFKTDLEKTVALREVFGGICGAILILSMW